ncbi:MAG: hypothetical protein WCJ81_06285 [bacterium]
MDGAWQDMVLPPLMPLQDHVKLFPLSIVLVGTPRLHLSVSNTPFLQSGLVGTQLATPQTPFSTIMGDDAEQ